MVGIKVKITFT